MQMVCILGAHKATAELYTLSLHDALPISRQGIIRGLFLGGEAESGCHMNPLAAAGQHRRVHGRCIRLRVSHRLHGVARSEEHTSELQSQSKLVCRLRLGKKKPEVTARQI